MVHTPMNKESLPIRRALISVSDKRHIVEFARLLVASGVELLSTGGTGEILSKEQIPFTAVHQITKTPEMMDGRVKTMHPAIAGGILGLRDRHALDAQAHDIQWIDLVVCNLYPFAQTIAKEGVVLDEALENIDVGGPTMIRSAAKNVGWVTVLTDADDYALVAKELKESGTVSYQLRRALSAKAFAHTASYDALIASYLTEEEFPNELPLSFSLFTGAQKGGLNLRYGENPHQMAAVYRRQKVKAKNDSFSLLDCTVLQGKQLSFNNLGDTYGALDCLREFREPACVIVKHATPCGVSSHEDPLLALQRAFEADSLSAFGGIVTLNRPFTLPMAQYLSDKFIEVLTAVSFEPKALELLAKKKNLRVVATGELPPLAPVLSGRFIGDDLLIQHKDAHEVTQETVKVVTSLAPDEKQMEELLFAWKLVKHVKSNAIVTTKDKTSCGIGGGQVSRVDATKIALEKSGSTVQMVLASDAFFPFRDSIDALRQGSVEAIIQPGGSIRDQEVIQACNEAGIAMVFTGIRSFLHA